MKQIILKLDTGKMSLEEVPAPCVQPGHILIRTTASVISTGTEGMLMKFGKAGWIGKLKQQPDKWQQVLDKIKTDGISPTIKAVRNKLDHPVALGYSQAGVVMAVGTGIHDIKVGDRVASNGAHAEVVSVPRNLVAKIPDGVPDEDAAFTVIGAIALQGIRLAQPTLGETAVVYGLGLVGQITAQLLLANGCRVIGIEPNHSRLALAASFGVVPLADASGDAVRGLTGGYGADAVLITASSNSDEIIAMAADMCRKRGRIVLTGVVGLNIVRDHFFKKELSFQVSAAYGPGRYESQYEQHGLDYPIAHVRWTEGRNFEAVLYAMKMGSLKVSQLVTMRKPIADFDTVYRTLADPEQLAVLFTYPGMPDMATAIRHTNHITTKSIGSVAVVGAGTFTAAQLLPALKSAAAVVKTIVSSKGLSAATLAAKHGIPQSGTDFQSVLADEDITAVIIATPHHTHASFTAAALAAGKHVFVEKPLALSREEINGVEQALQTSAATLTVGFNRRYAPLAIEAKNLLSNLAGPLNISITVNAGAIPREHWTQDAMIGGGRLLGEACHFTDLCAYFTGSAITAVCANAPDGQKGIPHEHASILLRFADGSNAAINYFSNGSKAYDKERVELYRAGRTIIIENWRSLRSFGFRKNVSKRTTQDKGHTALIKAWIMQLKSSGPPVMSSREVINSSLAAIAVPESISQSAWVSV